MVLGLLLQAVASRVSESLGCSIVLLWPWLLLAALFFFCGVDVEGRLVARDCLLLSPPFEFGGTVKLMGPMVTDGAVGVG